MKTKTINNENKASFKNALNYSIIKTDSEGNRVEIDISLSDPCHNGHNDFSITGSVYEAGKLRIDKYMVTGGAIGSYIAKQFPEFAIFNRLHLCDANGVPMYAIANGFYHLTNGFYDKTKDLKTEFCEYYRVTPEQFDVLATAKDQDYYGYLLIKLNILDQWKTEANEAIKLLELLTGDKFKDDSVKSNFDALTPERIAEIEEQINAGYYSAENIAH